jgi:hypothetical protein
MQPSLLSIHAPKSRRQAAAECRGPAASLCIDELALHGLETQNRELDRDQLGEVLRQALATSLPREAVGGMQSASLGEVNGVLELKPHARPAEIGEALGRTLAQILKTQKGRG